MTAFILIGRRGAAGMQRVREFYRRDHLLEAYHGMYRTLAESA